MNTKNSATAGRIALEDGRYADAIMHFNIVISGQPDDSQTWLLLGKAQHFSGRLNDAIASYREAARFGQTRPIALFNIARIYARREDETNTLMSLHEAVESGFRESDFRDDMEFAFIRDVAEFQGLADKALPASSRPEYQGLDFWRGNWRIVDTKTEQQVAQSDSQSASEQFLFHEIWSGNETSGRRLCYYEPNAAQWKMLILTPEYQSELTGNIVDGVLKCEGELRRIDGEVMPVIAEVSRSGENINYRLQTNHKDEEEPRVLADWHYRPGFP